MAGRVSRVYVVTHGKRFEGPDPSMTLEGIKQIEALRDFIPPLEKIPEVWLGTGKRFWEVAQALGVDLHHCIRYSGSAFGTADSDKKSKDGARIVVLADGREVSPDAFLSDFDANPATEGRLLKLPDSSVVCTGRCVPIALGVRLEYSRSGVVYMVKHNGKKILSLGVTNEVWREEE